LPEDLADKDLIDLLKRDKKAVNKWPRFVLISKIGKVYSQDGQYAVEVAPELVEKVLDKL
jgi:3-dehydroquinate synthetase